MKYKSLRDNPEYREMSLKEIQEMELTVMKTVHEVCVKHGIRYYMIGGTLLGAVRHGGFIPWDDDIDIAMLREDFDRFKEIYDKEIDEKKYFLQHFDSDPYFDQAMMRICVKGTLLDIPSIHHLKFCKCAYLDIFPLDAAPQSKELQLQHMKELKRIDRIIQLKNYHIYKKDNTFRVLFKQMVSIALGILPMRKFQQKRLQIMQKYNESNTGYVVQSVSHYPYYRQIRPADYFGDPKPIKFEDTEFYAPSNIEGCLQMLFGDKYMQIPPESKRELPTPVYIKL